MPARAERRLTGLLALTLALAGCSLAPPPQLPEVPMAASYREEAPWTPAQPADQLSRDGWWQLYGDAELDALQQRLLANSPDLAAALARYRQAEAVTRQSESAQLPRLSGSATVQRLQQSQMRPLRAPPAPNACGCLRHKAGAQPTPGCASAGCSHHALAISTSGRPSPLTSPAPSPCVYCPSPSRADKGQKVHGSVDGLGPGTATPTAPPV